MRPLDWLGNLMGVAIGRGFRGQESISCTTSAATTPRIEKRSLAGGSFRIPAGSSITTVTFYGAQNTSDDLLPMYDKSRAAIEITVGAGQIHPLPDEIYNTPYYGMVTNAAGTITVSHVG